MDIEFGGCEKELFLLISQRQMKEWCPAAVAAFKSAMPPVDVPYPDFYIGSAKTAESTRLALVEELESPTEEKGAGKSYMEEIHGAEGDAILIYQNAFTGRKWDYHAQERFTHFILHELGHFFAIYNENSEDLFFRFMDHPDDYVAALGYSFWSEFIAETIACKISPDEAIDWTRENWYPTRNSLVGYLRTAFTTGDYTIDYYALAMYFATLLSDKRTLSFLKAADVDLDKTGLTEIVDEEYRETMEELKSYLSKLASREQYWRVKVQDLEYFGELIIDLERARKMAEFNRGLNDRK